jgi:aspartate carbamoyltransferase regulatory subunit
METFRCQNPNCGKDSDYSLAEIQAKKSTVLCQHCQTIHHLAVLKSPRGAAPQLRAGGLYWNPG